MFVVSPNILICPPDRPLLVKEAHVEPLALFRGGYLSQTSQGPDKPSVREDNIIFQHRHVWCFGLEASSQGVNIIVNAFLRVRVRMLKIVQVRMVLFRHIVRIDVVGQISNPLFVPA